jgi:eukaryotic-like serine/threonine-protein kinase
MKKDLWQRAEELFHNALEHPPEARRAFLDRACGEDAELRRQVDTLLSQDEQAGSFLEKPAFADASVTPNARGSLVGRQLGQYRILSSLGAGGMGEVYRAHDGKLGRDVAIKTLPPEFARDPERIARFNREAKLLASLNHPNIAAIYGLEESGGTNFLVLELVEGDTLVDRVKAGPVPVEEALRLALQIVEAIEAAHEKGVIHRDLKPANIKVTPDGMVKVLDFGLAKAYAADQEVVLSNSPTLSNAATQQGVILGTAAYMSPEQARGSTIDKRCDIWSFGVVLFEMLTGKQFFAGETVSDTLAAVLRSDVDWNLLPANTPASIQTLLRRCLNRDRKERLRDIGEARIAISQYLANPSGPSVHETVDESDRHKHLVGIAWISAVVILVAALIFLGIGYYRKVSEPRQVTRFEFTLPEDQQFSSILGATFLAVAPDGGQFVYVTNKGLFSRSLDKWDAQCLVNSGEIPASPFFSPDGQWIAYRSAAENKLKKVSVHGGMPIALCNVGAFSGAFWGADDTIIYGEYEKGLMMRVPANGGNPQVLFKGDATYYHPQLLPDGKSWLFTLSPSPYRIAARSPESPEEKILVDQGDRSFFLPTGHLVYGLGHNLYAVSFKPSKLALSGDRVPIVEGIYRNGPSAAPQYDISPSGTLIYAQMTAIGHLPKRRLVWVSRDGKEESIDIPPQNFGVNGSAPRISPSGTQLAFAATTGRNVDIWVSDLAHKTLNKITVDEGRADWPLWRPNGEHILYWSSLEHSRPALKRKTADGSGEAENLGSLQETFIGPPMYSWSSDGRILSTERSLNPIQLSIVTLSIKGGLAKEPLLEGKNLAGYPQISPNGRWLAYTSNESGRNEVYVRPFPDVKNRRWTVSTNGGYGAIWSPDGRELFYRNGESVVAVEVESDSVFNPKQPKELFKGSYFSIGESMLPMWDISPKDKRFLMIKEEGSTPSDSAGARKISVVMNWTEELKKRVPVK